MSQQKVGLCRPQSSKTGYMSRYFGQKLKFSACSLLLLARTVLNYIREALQVKYSLSFNKQQANPSQYGVKMFIYGNTQDSCSLSLSIQEVETVRTVYDQRYPNIYLLYAVYRSVNSRLKLVETVQVSKLMSIHKKMQ